MGEIYDFSKQIDFTNLTYKFKSGNIPQIIFIAFRGPLHLYNDIANGDISIEKSRKR